MNNYTSESQGSVRAMGARPVANAPEISQIMCLGGEASPNIPAEHVAYHPTGGDWYKDKSENNDAERTPRSNFRETDSEFVRLSKQGGHEGLLKVAGCDESPFMNAKEMSLRKDRMSPSHSQPAGVQHASINVAPGNPIWLGGSGPERGFVPGKRFMKQEHKESPFALSDDWDRTQKRNPDKI